MVLGCALKYLLLFLSKLENTKALINYLSALKAIEKKPNDYLKNSVYQKIAMIKSSNNEKEEALKIYLSLYKNYEIPDKNKPINNEYFSLLLNLSYME